LKKKPILDPLWITKGSYLDPEYFNYVLLAASQKYRVDFEEGQLDYFYEIFFHSLNLNNLAIDGRLFDFKLHPIFKSERIHKITTDLKQIYTKKEEVVEIFRNANYVFLNIIMEYMEVQMDVLEKIEFFYLNEMIHEQSEIFLVINRLGNKKYNIWKISSDLNRDFGYSFKKIKSITIKEIKENALREELDKLDDPELENMIESKNVLFTVLDGPSEKISANIIKDIILLNKGVAKGMNFEPSIIEEFYGLLMSERLMPFTLNQWID
jgi:hypothetical protein